MKNIDSIFELSNLSLNSIKNEDKELTFEAIQTDVVGIKTLIDQVEVQDKLFYQPHHRMTDETKRKREEKVLNKTVAVVEKEQRREEILIEKKISFDSAIEEEERHAFFRDQWPVEWYSLKRNDKGLIKIVLPEFIQKKKRIIYIFRNRKEERFLIGKTGTCFNQRMSKYQTLFNKEGSEKKATKKGRKAFLTDMKNQPESFDVGILHTLGAEEDLDLFETLFIKHKRELYKLYNDNKGGGGGWSHVDELPTVYAIPKEEIASFTPEKYYSFQKNEEGRIRPQFTPTFKKNIEQKEGLEETQEFVYVIKKKDTGKRYIGISINPLKRSREHGYHAEYFDPENEKYDSRLKDGFLHPAMAKSPDKFSIGLLPLQSKEKVDPIQLSNYVLLEGIAKVEKHLIKIKKSHFSEKGYNGNYGGGGPIAKKVTKFAKRKLDF